MFHKFSESARRVIFFARHEASRLGGTTVSTEHLLLGLLRENSSLVQPLLAPDHTVEAFRRAAERAAGSSKERLPASVEMRLADPAKMALTYAEEESDRVQSGTIDALHLLLGLMRTPGSKTAKLAEEFGLKVGDIRLKAAHQLATPVQSPFGRVLCTFYGIEIRFDVASEEVPRIIAQYHAQMDVIDIDPLKVIHSDLPARAQSMVLEWVKLHKDEIIRAWIMAKAGNSAPPIPPLE